MTSAEAAFPSVAGRASPCGAAAVLSPITCQSAASGLVFNRRGRSQPECVEPDESARIALVVRAAVILERDDIVTVKRSRRAPADYRRAALVEPQPRRTCD